MKTIIKNLTNTSISILLAYSLIACGEDNNKVNLNNELNNELNNTLNNEIDKIIENNTSSTIITPQEVSQETPQEEEIKNETNDSTTLISQEINNSLVAQEIISYFQTSTYIKEFILTGNLEGKLGDMLTTYGQKVEVSFNPEIIRAMPPENVTKVLYSQDLIVPVELSSTSGLENTENYIAETPIFKEEINEVANIYSIYGSSHTFNGQITNVSPNVTNITDCNMTQGNRTLPISTSYTLFDTEHSGTFGSFRYTGELSKEPLGNYTKTTKGNLYCNFEFENGAKIENLKVGSFKLNVKENIGGGSSGVSSGAGAGDSPIF